MRMIARFEKESIVRFISHLDLQRTFQRAFRRAKLPMAYSQGFNPHPLLSFGSALAVGYTSEAEWLDIKLTEKMEPAVFIALVNAVLPHGLKLVEARVVDDTYPSLTAKIYASVYEVRMHGGGQNCIDAFESLLEGEIFVMKHTKSGKKRTDIRPSVYRYEAVLDGEDACITVEGQLDPTGSLQLGLLLEALFENMGTKYTCDVHRKAVLFQA